MNFKLHIWRQADTNSRGEFCTYNLDNISGDTSFLEMLDALNEQLIHKGEDAVSFDYDCREGICGACSLVINGYAHGEKLTTTTCQLYMREYANCNELWIEPFRADAFPIIKDLSIDRSAFDRIIQAGGYISVHTGNAPDANSQLVGKSNADTAFNSATCIGCGACVAVCPNASASLFVGAKITHLFQLPQGKVEHRTRLKAMLNTMADEGFGVCSNHRHCQEVCPKDISVSNITTINRLF